MIQATGKTEAAAATEAPAAPGAPSAPAAVTITTVGATGQPLTLAVPATSEQLDRLVQQRREFSEQLSSVSARRRELSSEIRNAPEGASRAGLESRIQILDQRILQLETDLALTGRAIAAAPSELRTSTSQPSQTSGAFEDGVFAGGFFSLLFAIPVVLYFARRRWKKGAGSKPANRSELQGESAQRLERLEQGMESIAIEIERVSEGQRFVTKLLSEVPEPVGALRRSESESTDARTG